MYITCLDVEGVLVPKSGLHLQKQVEFNNWKRTTRDEPDYNKLMRWRLDTLKSAWSRDQRNSGNNFQD